jgi:hypothetical protein
MTKPKANATEKKAKGNKVQFQKYVATADPKGAKYCPLHKTNVHDAKESKVILAQCKKMASSYDSKNSFKDGKRQKTEYNNSKTKQMFGFKVNVFIAASNKKESENKSNEKV